MSLNGLLVLLILSAIFLDGCSPNQEITSINTNNLDSNRAENICPFGLVEDPYPGRCGRYLDSDENHVCDHSE